LKKPEKELILEKIQLHLDEEGKLYLRFDKQTAFENSKIVLTKEEDGYYFDDFDSLHIEEYQKLKKLD